MPELILNPASQKLLDAYLSNPAHALLLTGADGVGLGSLAYELATKLSGKTQAVTTLAPEKGLISIERVRTLYEQTRSIQSEKRAIIIDDAESMSTDAQNALLKLLEEPVTNIHFILTSHRSAFMLATIKSRAQTVQILPITDEQSKALLTPYGFEGTRTNQILFLASGKPAEISRLAADDAYFEGRVAVISDARAFLQASPYDRLALVKKYTDRLSAMDFLSMCAKLLNFSFIRQKNVAAAENMEVFDTVMQRIEMNGHVRTHLMYLVTKLA